MQGNRSTARPSETGNVVDSVVLYEIDVTPFKSSGTGARDKGPSGFDYLDPVESGLRPIITARYPQRAPGSIDALVSRTRWTPATSILAQSGVSSSGLASSLEQQQQNEAQRTEGYSGTGRPALDVEDNLQGVEGFVFPLGLCLSKVERRPTLHSFVLTGTRAYGYCLTRWSRCSNEVLATVRMQIGTAIMQMGDESYGDDDDPEASELPTIPTELYEPKALCVLCTSPFYTLITRAISTLCNDRALTPDLARYVWEVLDRLPVVVARSGPSSPLNPVEPLWVRGPSILSAAEARGLLSSDQAHKLASSRARAAAESVHRQPNKDLSTTTDSTDSSKSVLELQRTNSRSIQEPSTKSGPDPKKIYYRPCILESVSHRMRFIPPPPAKVAATLPAFVFPPAPYDSAPALDPAQLSILCACLDPEQIVSLLTALMCGLSVLCISNEIEVLSPALETLTALLYPLKWPYVYIPLLLPTMQDVLDAPMPFLVGAHSSIVHSLCNDTPTVVADFTEHKLYLHQSGDRAEFPPKMPNRPVFPVASPLRPRDDAIDAVRCFDQRFSANSSIASLLCERLGLPHPLNAHFAGSSLYAGAGVPANSETPSSPQGPSHQGSHSHNPTSASFVTLQSFHALCRTLLLGDPFALPGSNSALSQAARAHLSSRFLESKQTARQKQAQQPQTLRQQTRSWTSLPSGTITSMFTKVQSAFGNTRTDLSDDMQHVNLPFCRLPWRLAWSLFHALECAATSLSEITSIHWTDYIDHSVLRTAVLEVQETAPFASRPLYTSPGRLPGDVTPPLTTEPPQNDLAASPMSSMSGASLSSGTPIRTQSPLHKAQNDGDADQEATDAEFDSVFRQLSKDGDQRASPVVEFPPVSKMHSLHLPQQPQSASLVDRSVPSGPEQATERPEAANRPSRSASAVSCDMAKIISVTPEPTRVPLPALELNARMQDSSEQSPLGSLMPQVRMQSPPNSQLDTLRTPVAGLADSVASNLLPTIPSEQENVCICNAPISASIRSRVSSSTKESDEPHVTLHSASASSRVVPTRQHNVSRTTRAHGQSLAARRQRALNAAKAAAEQYLADGRPWVFASRKEAQSKVLKLRTIESILAPDHLPANAQPVLYSEQVKQKQKRTRSVDRERRELQSYYQPPPGRSTQVGLIMIEPVAPPSCPDCGGKVTRPVTARRPIRRVRTGTASAHSSDDSRDEFRSGYRLTTDSQVTDESSLEDFDTGDDEVSLNNRRSVSGLRSKGISDDEESQDLGSGDQSDSAGYGHGDSYTSGSEAVICMLQGCSSEGEDEDETDSSRGSAAVSTGGLETSAATKARMEERARRRAEKLALHDQQQALRRLQMQQRVGFEQEDDEEGDLGEDPFGAAFSKLHIQTLAQESTREEMKQQQVLNTRRPVLTLNTVRTLYSDSELDENSSETEAQFGGKAPSLGQGWGRAAEGATRSTSVSLAGSTPSRTRRDVPSCELAVYRPKLSTSPSPAQPSNISQTTCALASNQQGASESGRVRGKIEDVLVLQGNTLSLVDRIHSLGGAIDLWNSFTDPINFKAALSANAPLFEKREKAEVPEKRPAVEAVAHSYLLRSGRVPSLISATTMDPVTGALVNHPYLTVPPAQARRWEEEAWTAIQERISSKENSPVNGDTERGNTVKRTSTLDDWRAPGLPLPHMMHFLRWGELPSNTTVVPGSAIPTAYPISNLGLTVESADFTSSAASTDVVQRPPSPTHSTHSSVAPSVASRHSLGRESQSGTSTPRSRGHRHARSRMLSMLAAPLQQGTRVDDPDVSPTGSRVGSPILDPLPGAAPEWSRPCTPTGSSLLVRRSGSDLAHDTTSFVNRGTDTDSDGAPLPPQRVQSSVAEQRSGVTLGLTDFSNEFPPSQLSNRISDSAANNAVAGALPDLGLTLIHSHSGVPSGPSSDPIPSGTGVAFTKEQLDSIEAALAFSTKVTSSAGETEDATSLLNQLTHVFQQLESNAMLDPVSSGSRDEAARVQTDEATSNGVASRQSMYAFAVRRGSQFTIFSKLVESGSGSGQDPMTELTVRRVRTEAQDWVEWSTPAPFSFWPDTWKKSSHAMSNIVVRRCRRAILKTFASLFTGYRQSLHILTETPAVITLRQVYLAQKQRHISSRLQEETLRKEIRSQQELALVHVQQQQLQLQMRLESLQKRNENAAQQAVVATLSSVSPDMTSLGTSPSLLSTTVSSLQNRVGRRSIGKRPTPPYGGGPNGGTDPLAATKPEQAESESGRSETPNESVGSSAALDAGNEDSPGTPIDHRVPSNMHPEDDRDMMGDEYSAIANNFNAKEFLNICASPDFIPFLTTFIEQNQMFDMFKQERLSPLLTDRVAAKLQSLLQSMPYQDPNHASHSQFDSLVQRYLQLEGYSSTSVRPAWVAGQHSSGSPISRMDSDAFHLARSTSGSSIGRELRRFIPDRSMSMIPDTEVHRSVSASSVVRVTSGTGMFGGHLSISGSTLDTSVSGNLIQKQPQSPTAVPVDSAGYEPSPIYRAHHARRASAMLTAQQLSEATVAAAEATAYASAVANAATMLTQQNLANRNQDPSVVVSAAMAAAAAASAVATAANVLDETTAEPAGNTNSGNAPASMLGQAPPPVPTAEEAIKVLSSFSEDPLNPNDPIAILAADALLALALGAHDLSPTLSEPSPPISTLETEIGLVAEAGLISTDHLSMLLKCGYVRVPDWFDIVYARRKTRMQRARTFRATSKLSGTLFTQGMFSGWPKRLFELGTGAESLDLVCLKVTPQLITIDQEYAEIESQARLNPWFPGIKDKLRKVRAERLRIRSECVKGRLKLVEGATQIIIPDTTGLDSPTPYVFEIVVAPSHNALVEASQSSVQQVSAVTAFPLAPIAITARFSPLAAVRASLFATPSASLLSLGRMLGRGYPLTNVNLDSLYDGDGESNDPTTHMSQELSDLSTTYPSPHAPVPPPPVVTVLASGPRPLPLTLQTSVNPIHTMISQVVTNVAIGASGPTAPTPLAAAVAVTALGATNAFLSASPQLAQGNHELLTNSPFASSGSATVVQNSSALAQNLAGMYYSYTPSMGGPAGVTSRAGPITNTSTGVTRWLLCAPTARDRDMWIAAILARTRLPNVALAGSGVASGASIVPPSVQLSRMQQQQQHLASLEQSKLAATKSKAEDGVASPQAARTFARSQPSVLPGRPQTSVASPSTLTHSPSIGTRSYPSTAPKGEKEDGKPDEDLISQRHQYIAQAIDAALEAHRADLRSFDSLGLSHAAYTGTSYLLSPLDITNPDAERATLFDFFSSASQIPMQLRQQSLAGQDSTAGNPSPPLSAAATAFLSATATVADPLVAANLRQAVNAECALANQLRNLASQPIIAHALLGDLDQYESASVRAAKTVVPALARSPAFEGTQLHPLGPPPAEVQEAVAAMLNTNNGAEAVATAGDVNPPATGDGASPQSTQSSGQGPSRATVASSTDSRSMGTSTSANPPPQVPAYYLAHTTTSGQLADSGGLLKTSVAQMSAACMPKASLPPHSARMLVSMGVLSSSEGTPEEASATAARILELCDRHLPPRHPSKYDIMSARGSSSADEKDAEGRGLREFISSLNQSVMARASNPAFPPPPLPRFARSLLGNESLLQRRLRLLLERTWRRDEMQVLKMIAAIRQSILEEEFVVPPNQQPGGYASSKTISATFATMTQVSAAPPKDPFTPTLRYDPPSPPVRADRKFIAACVRDALYESPLWQLEPALARRYALLASIPFPNTPAYAAISGSAPNSVTTFSSAVNHQAALLNLLHPNPPSTHLAPGPGLATCLLWEVVRALTAAKLMMRSIAIVDRRPRFTKYKNCFTGKEVVSWLLAQRITPNLTEALRLGAILLACGVIVPSTKDREDEVIEKHRTKELEREAMLRRIVAGSINIALGFNFSHLAMHRFTAHQMYQYLSNMRNHQLKLRAVVASPTSGPQSTVPPTVSQAVATLPRVSREGLAQTNEATRDLLRSYDKHQTNYSLHLGAALRDLLAESESNQSPTAVPVLQQQISRSTGGTSPSTDVPVHRRYVVHLTGPSQSQVNPASVPSRKLGEDEIVTFANDSTLYRFMTHENEELFRASALQPIPADWLIAHALFENLELSDRPVSVWSDSVYPLCFASVDAARYLIAGSRICANEDEAVRVLTRLLHLHIIESSTRVGPAKPDEVVRIGPDFLYRFNLDVNFSQIELDLESDFEQDAELFINRTDSLNLIMSRVLEAHGHSNLAQNPPTADPLPK